MGLLALWAVLNDKTERRVSERISLFIKDLGEQDACWKKDRGYAQA